ncbi:purine-nucleoside phosphorylase [Aldersonia kunmingensis]|uniref:purine-nucleoside phosphorylase n=1 Tax=Aldersonia kunmingensis TaxID=408066 RepID=UPI00082B1E31|nr:purine-nucleoside phosphorylase [Aldersonia kunmingensis]
MDSSHAAAVIAERTGISTHRAAVVLGSGWQAAVAELGEPTSSVPMAELPGFETPTAAGHHGIIHSVDVAGTPVLVMMGRNHLYEGYSPAQVAFPVHAAVAAGAHTIVLTNAAGGIHHTFAVGEPVLISDHLNLTGGSPLFGAAHFVDMVDAYDPALRMLALDVDPSLETGVYAGLLGPQYETPAEIRMLRAVGADLVGMSTVNETVAARALGARVLGISLVTNLAAGITGGHLAHAEVLAEGAAAAPRLGRLLRGVLERLDDPVTSS